jgi:magnesium-transporting ATPase (P-type)
VAREAADMILLDDNFASIVNAVEEGRAAYSNIRRFTSYVFTSNTAEALPFLLFAFSAGRIPLALPVMAVLAIDLGTDLLPALALGAERPEPHVMQRRPRRRGEHIVERRLLVRSFVWLGGLASVAMAAAFFVHYWVNGYAGQALDLPADGTIYHQGVAVALAAVVFAQVGNVFTQRAERVSILRVGFLSNPLVLPAVAAELAIMALIVYVPFLQEVVGTAGLPLAVWPVLALVAPAFLLADELQKAVRRGRRSRPGRPVTGARRPEVAGPDVEVV